MTSDLDKQVRVMTIIAVAFMVSVVVYVLVAFLVTGQPPSPTAPPPHTSPTLPIALLGMGAATVGAGFFIRRFLLERAGERDIKRYFTVFVIGFAFFEAPTVYGLVASFLTRDVQWVAIAAVMSLASMVLTFPRRDSVDLYLASR